MGAWLAEKRKALHGNNCEGQHSSVEWAWGLGSGRLSLDGSLVFGGIARKARLWGTEMLCWKI